MKVGFGERPAIGVKDVEFYYAYAVAAHINGYRVFNPGMVASCVSLVSCLYVHKDCSSDPLFYSSSSIALEYIPPQQLRVMPAAQYLSPIDMACNAPILERSPKSTRGAPCLFVIQSFP